MSKRILINYFLIFLIFFVDYTCFFLLSYYLLINNGIKVTIRLNIDFHNSENLKELIGELYNKFGIHPNLNIYVWPVFEDNTNVKTLEEHASIFTKVKELEDIILSYGYFVGTIPKSEISFIKSLFFFILISYIQLDSLVVILLDLNLYLILLLINIFSISLISTLL